MEQNDNNTTEKEATPKTEYNPESGKYTMPPADTEKPGLKMRQQQEAAKTEAETVANIDPNAPAPEVQGEVKKDYVPPVKPTDTYKSPEINPANLTQPSNPNLESNTTNPLTLVTDDKVVQKSELENLGSSMQAIIEESLNRVPKIDRDGVRKLVHNHPMIGGVEFQNDPEDENKAAVVMFSHTGYTAFKNAEEAGEGVHAVRIPAEGYYDLGPGTDISEVFAAQLKNRLGDQTEDISITLPEETPQPPAEESATHVVSETDLKNNSELVEKSVEAGETVFLAKEEAKDQPDLEKKEDRNPEGNKAKKKNR